MSLLTVCAIALPLPNLQALNFFERFLFSDKAYAKHIEVKTNVLTPTQASTLLANPTQEPAQWTADELNNAPSKYLVVRVKNQGKKTAWGSLTCSVPCIWEPLRIPVISIGEEFSCYLISLDGYRIRKKKTDAIPDITFEWTELYTK